MNKKEIFAFLIPATVTISMISFFAFGNAVALFDPKGLIAQKERELISFASILALFIVTPVLLMLFYTVYKFRDGNTKSRHNPESSAKISNQLVWWSIPTLVIIILAVFTWKNTHVLDPYKSLQSENAPITIQAVALRWKWLFIYPRQNIGTVNFIEIPVNTPVNFELTADAPMNSFWIPRLGGQIYAMSGMSTNTHLIASSVGDYQGSAAEISGKGFSGMRFTTRVTSKNDFDNWIKKVQASGKVLDKTTYDNLSKPSENNPVVFYSLAENNLYNNIMMKFMMPKKGAMNMQGVEH